MFSFTRTCRLIFGFDLLGTLTIFIEHLPCYFGVHFFDFQNLPRQTGLIAPLAHFFKVIKRPVDPREPVHNFFGGTARFTLYRLCNAV